MESWGYTPPTYYNIKAGVILERSLAKPRSGFADQAQVAWTKTA